MTKKAHDIGDLFNSAAEVLITPEASQTYESWSDAINAPSIKPSLPTTHAAAIPDGTAIVRWSRDHEIKSAVLEPTLLQKKGGR